MCVCCECCVPSDRGLCDGLITHPEESYRLWRVVVCDQETSKTRRLMPATGLWKCNHNGVVTPGKQTNQPHSLTTQQTTTWKNTLISFLHSYVLIRFYSRDYAHVLNLCNTAWGSLTI
jgi:hypothetical protein